jgi:hypothetical protein
MVMATIAVGIAGCGKDQLPDQMMAKFATVSGGEANTASGEYATIGGGSHNSATAFHTMVGGGSYNAASVGHSVVGGGYHNTTSASLTTVGGGYANVASRRGATVSGGASNTADARISTIGGGFRNEASGWGDTISGGRHNITSSLYPTIGGGAENTAAGLAATVAGGAGNEATASHATVGGGLSNRATDIHATVIGGYENIGEGSFSTVAGGSHNMAAGDHSLAAGHRARVAAIHRGAFLYADSSDSDFHSAGANEFAVRATGGVRFVTAIDSSGSPVAGVELAPGSGSWSSLSDREVKSDVSPADGSQVLMLLTELPIFTWNYTGQDPSIRHLGPMAQDFHAAFGLGESDRHIGNVDADGVALAAIQGLYELVQDKDAQLASQQQQIAALETRLAALEQASREAGAQAGSLATGTLPGWLLLGYLCLAVYIVSRVGVHPLLRATKSWRARTCS